MEWITTSTILEGLCDYANRNAWERLVCRFRTPIVAFARQMGLADNDAEDVAQETLIAFAGAVREKKYEPARGRLNRYLFGIAQRQALSRRRMGARQAARQEDRFSDSVAMSPESAAADIWDREWEQAVLRQCLNQVRCEVDAVTFQAFELVVRDDRSPTDASEMLQVPIKTVYNAKHRILKRIRTLRLELETDVP